VRLAELREPLKYILNVARKKQTRPGLDLYINAPVDELYLNVLVALDYHGGSSCLRRQKKTPSGVKVLVEEASVDTLYPLQLPGVQDRRRFRH